MLTSIKTMAAAFLLGALAAASSTWIISSWYHDSLELTAQKAANQIKRDLQTTERSIASAVQEANVKVIERERIVDRGIIKEINTHEIYHTQCITDDGVQLLNSLTNTSGSTVLNAKVQSTIKSTGR